MCVLIPFAVSKDLFVLGDTRGSWDEAKDWCQEEGHELASIRDAAENTAAAHWGLEAGNGGMWIGGNREDDLAVWQWLDGTEWSYTNWDSTYGWDEPNGDGKCLELYPGGTWNDLPCGQSDKLPLCRRSSYVPLQTMDLIAIRSTPSLEHHLLANSS